MDNEIEIKTKKTLETSKPTDWEEITKLRLILMVQQLAPQLHEGPPQPLSTMSQKSN